MSGFSEKRSYDDSFKIMQPENVGKHRTALARVTGYAIDSFI
jgi:hypothetical protein